jgi:hypothetical protein
MADTPDLGSGAARCAGSTPAPSTLFANGAENLAVTHYPEKPRP